MKTKNNLARILNTGQFAVTAEISPPQDTNFETIRKNANHMKGYVGMEEGLDAIAHMTCRDRNRIALQMDILAVSAFGVNNILCLSGDPISFGNHPEAKPVFDLDSIQLIRMVKKLRDERKFDNGESIVGTEPRLFIGAAVNPSAQPLESAVGRLKDKVTAGADFVQTQPIYNIEGLKKWMELIREEGLHKEVKILAGITPVTSLAAARYMKTKIPNVDIPEIIIERLKKARNKEEAAEEGLKIAVETINQLKQIEGIAGVHIMTLQREELIPKICKAAGLYPRP
jgi:5,10-methylenetetrahydrofolate reductase